MTLETFNQSDEETDFDIEEGDCQQPEQPVLKDRGEARRGDSHNQHLSGFGRGGTGLIRCHSASPFGWMSGRVQSEEVEKIGADAVRLREGGVGRGRSVIWGLVVHVGSPFWVLDSLFLVNYPLTDDDQKQASWGKMHLKGS